MNPTTRPPPKVLFIHNGAPFDGHVKHLADAGLRVFQTHANAALAQATKLQPDIVVLDFDVDGDVVAILKGDESTRHIPVVALVELARPN